MGYCLKAVIEISNLLDFWHVDTPVNLALENRGFFKWQFTTKLVAEREKKVPH